MLFLPSVSLEKRTSSNVHAFFLSFSGKEKLLAGYVQVYIVYTIYVKKQDLVCHDKTPKQEVSSHRTYEAPGTYCRDC